jgi:hypothetical protein
MLSMFQTSYMLCDFAFSTTKDIKLKEKNHPTDETLGYLLGVSTIEI